MTQSVGVLRVGGSPAALRLGGLVETAEACLARNVVPGRGPDEPARYLRAGAGYHDPWTRDAAINSWQAAAWLLPEVAADTLRMVCDAGGRVVWDDQWWDQVMWIIGAHRVAMLTGDDAWADWAHRIGLATIERLDERCLDADGLYRGPAVMADGISGYPPQLHDPDRAGESFVLDHAGTDRLRCLSTNALYVWAFRVMAELAAAVGAESHRWTERADALAARVRDEFWLAEQGRFGYLRTPDGRRFDEQEALGSALAILSGVATDRQAGATLATLRRAPRGVAAVWPHYPGFDDDRFGRHNGALWPMIMGVWAQAEASTGDAGAFGIDLRLLCRLFEGSDRDFFEVYHPVTGRPDGGWQSGRGWRSEPDQTWSATTLIGTVLHGVAGMEQHWDRLDCRPCLPPGLDLLELSLPWRGGRLEVRLQGTGSRVTQCRLDGRAVAASSVPVDGADHVLEIGCRP